MNFLIKYGISIILVGIIWGLASLTLDPTIIIVAIIVTGTVTKEKYDEWKD